MYNGRGMLNENNERKCDKRGTFARVYDKSGTDDVRSFAAAAWKRRG